MALREPSDMQIAIALLNAARDYLEKDAAFISITQQEVTDIASDVGDILVKLEALTKSS